MSATSFANFDGKPPDDLAAALGLDADDEEGLAAGLGWELPWAPCEL